MVPVTDTNHAAAASSAVLAPALHAASMPWQQHQNQGVLDLVDPRTFEQQLGPVPQHAHTLYQHPQQVAQPGRMEAAAAAAAGFDPTCSMYASQLQDQAAWAVGAAAAAELGRLRQQGQHRGHQQPQQVKQEQEHQQELELEQRNALDTTCACALPPGAVAGTDMVPALYAAAPAAAGAAPAHDLTAAALQVEVPQPMQAAPQGAHRSNSVQDASKHAGTAQAAAGAQPGNPFTGLQHAAVGAAEEEPLQNNANTGSSGSRAMNSQQLLQKLQTVQELFVTKLQRLVQVEKAACQEEVQQLQQLLTTKQAAHDKEVQRLQQQLQGQQDVFQQEVQRLQQALRDEQAAHPLALQQLQQQLQAEQAAHQQAMQQLQQQAQAHQVGHQQQVQHLQQQLQQASQQLEEAKAQAIPQPSSPPACSILTAQGVLSASLSDLQAHYLELVQAHSVTCALLERSQVQQAQQAQEMDKLRVSHAAAEASQAVLQGQVLQLQKSAAVSAAQLAARQQQQQHQQPRGRQQHQQQHNPRPHQGSSTTAAAREPRRASSRERQQAPSPKKRSRWEPLPEDPAN